MALFPLDNNPSCSEESTVPILSSEQQFFIDKALEGNNILVDACIGSGKTTSIQQLCNRIDSSKRILYLTYNMLLKMDAKRKIKNSNAMVTNYHGFASYILYQNGRKASPSDSIQLILENQYEIPHYDVLIIDEYQDIEQEIAELLWYIKASNPGVQIIVVGDMAQKIYDKTTLNVPEFINDFLDEHLKLEFTLCFRLSADLAEQLGRVWQKTIKGVNTDCKVEYMNVDEATEYLKKRAPQDILCLGARYGNMTKVLNQLENSMRYKFNKKTVYASIRRSMGGATAPTPQSAIFTTFDASKGMERPICMVFDWTYQYWYNRIKQPGAAYEIIRNIFCVAASRGKQHIIFVSEEKDELLDENILSENPGVNTSLDIVSIDAMFDFKYKENVENAYRMLSIQEVNTDNAGHSEIYMRDHDALIDLTPCIELYQKAIYFKKYNIDRDISQFFSVNEKQKYIEAKKEEDMDKSTIEGKVLYLVSLITKHNRYRYQVRLPLVDESENDQLCRRLSQHFTGDEDIQLPSSILFANKDGELQFEAIGFADIIKDDKLYEIGYAQEFSHERFLSCACHMVAQKVSVGYLWNVRDNVLYSVNIPDERAFMDAVAIAVTKGKLDGYYPGIRPPKKQ